jgi:hypothetical protein
MCRKVSEVAELAMSHEITLRYNESLIKRAVLRYWWRQIGVGYILALVILAVCIATLIANGNTSWLVGAMATILAMGIFVMIALYTVPYRNALRKLKTMGDPKATLILADSSLTMSSGAGSSTVPWSSVTEIWQFPDFWLLFFSKSQFSTLPLADFSSEARAFFVEHLEASGGKVRPRGA